MNSSSTQEEKHNCKKCKDTGFMQTKTGWQYCDCVRKRIQKNILRSSGLTEMLKRKTFENFNRAEQPEMYDTALGYAKNYDSIKDDRCNGLAFVGTVGNGKTHLLAAIANLLIQRGIQVVLVNTPELIAELREAQFRDNDRLQDKLKYIKSAKVVMFDDLAKEKITEWVAMQYYLIINHRYINGLPTLFSSNCSFEELEDKLDPATVSRLVAMTKERMVMCDGDDYRFKE